MRLLSTLCATVCIFSFVVVLTTAGITEPKALLGTAGFAAIFAYHAAAAFAAERKKNSSEFIEEKLRVLSVLKESSNLAAALAELSASYRVTLDAPGLSLEGPCRVVDLSGASMEIRIEVRDEKVIKLSFTPKEFKGLSEVVSTLKADLPRPKRPPVTRDWMGNPIDRK